MSYLLAGLIFAVGVALGLGIGLLLAFRRQDGKRIPEDEARPILAPVLDRLQRLEALADAAGRHSLPPGGQDSEKPAAVATSDLIKSSYEELRRELPALIDAAVTARVAETESGIPAPTADSAVERLIAQRVGPIEKVVIDQANLIDALRVRSEETDVSLQHLIASIDRLCEVTPLARPKAPPPPFAKPPAAPTPPAAEIPRLAKESEAEPRKPRIPMARIFGALLAFGISRFLR